MLIIHFLQYYFRLYYVSEIIEEDKIVIDNMIFLKDHESKTNEGFIGFFDWLRIDQSTIVGIRMCFFEHHPYMKILECFTYTKGVFGNNFRELLFEECNYNPEISGDQDSTNNYVFESSDKSEYLFTFGLDGLSKSELNGLIEKSIEIPKENLLD